MMKPQQSGPSPSSYNADLSKAQDVIKWYWRHGIKREGKYYLSPGTWLDEVYRAKDAGVRFAAASEGRARLGIWGPSQTGKSTFLSRYLDAGADAHGRGSALDWGGEAIMFLASGDDDNTVVLNPWNHATDGSGCISYFTMRKDGEVDPDNPVKILLSTEKQILHALASGFCSECSKHCYVRNEVRYWNSREIVNTIVNGFECGVDPHLDERAYTFLHQIVDVLELLCRSDLIRYRNIDSSDLSGLRQQILDRVELHSSFENAMAFASVLFWDDLEVFTQAFKDLSAYRSDLLDKAVSPKAEITCSYQAAAVLLDIDSYNKLIQNNRSTTRLVDGLGVVSTPKGIAVRCDADTPMIKKQRDFALLQGVVWGLEIPLREDKVKMQSQTLHEVLSHAVIVDFPGVSNEGEAEGKNQISAESLSSDERQGELFTKVLKRGKTSSFVASCACDYNLDGFSILCRTMKDPGSPVQLSTGIRIWWESLTNTSIDDANSRLLPLNLVLTFFGKFISDIITTSGADDLGSILTKFSTLGPIANPRIVHTYATTYEHVPDTDGKILNNRRNCPATPEEKKIALAALLADSRLSEQFADRHTLEKVVMSDCGGVDYVLEKLLKDARGSERRKLLNRRREEWSTRFNSALLQALPTSADEATLRSERLDGWIDGIESTLERRQGESPRKDASQELGHLLRKFLYVDPEMLDPLPTGLRTDRTYSLTAYVEDQFDRWRDDRSFDRFREIGLGADQAPAVRSDLVEAALIREDDDFENHEAQSIEEWIRRQFGHIEDRTTAKEHRNFLALKLSDALTGYMHRDREQPESENRDAILDRLIEVTRLESNGARGYERSPHYFHFIEPFLQYIKSIRRLETAERPEQPGDKELGRILVPGN